MSAVVCKTTSKTSAQTEYHQHFRIYNENKIAGSIFFASFFLPLSSLPQKIEASKYPCERIKHFWHDFIRAADTDT